MTMPTLLFLSGIPSSGKSYFGHWLEENHGYVHIDAERPDELDRLGLRQVWDNACITQNCNHFADTLLARGQSAVFNWGFPVGCLSIAVALKRAGFSTWWFDADIDTARNAYIATGRPRQCFDKQAGEIQTSTNAIVAQLAPNIIRTLSENGVRLTPDEILNFMQHAI